MATERTTTQRLFDVLEWLGLIVVPIGILTSGYKYVWHDLKTSPTPVRLTVLVLGVAVIALAASIIVLMRAYRVERQAFRVRLGLKTLAERESSDGSLLPMYDRATPAYRWTGLSAINELGRTDVQDAISRRIRAGDKLSYTVADPANTFALVEQSSWEAMDIRGATELTDNINRSLAILQRYQTASVSVFLSARIPVFRVTEVGEHEIHVAHYDREGCGYYGTFLILTDEGSSADAVLFQWFKHYAAAERRNAVISDFQFKVSEAAANGKSVDETARAVMTGTEFEPWRKSFDRQFDWDLTQELVDAATRGVYEKIGRGE